MDSKNLTVAIQVCISIFKRCNNQLIITSLFFCLASRSLSCNNLYNEANGCEELDSICMVKKIGTYFGISSKIRFSWIKEWNVAMGLLKIFVTYFNPKVSLLGQTWHFDYKKSNLNSKRDLLVETPYTLYVWQTNDHFTIISSQFSAI